MNKKLAMLMFAIGLGAAAAPVLAVSCEHYCALARNACSASGTDLGTCNDNYNDCVGSCP